MPQPIARMYDSPMTAANVAEALKTARISPGDVHVIEGSGADAASITKFGIGPGAAKIYAEHLNEGQALVVVIPPFGYAATATSVMDKAGPVAVSVPTEAVAPVGRATSASVTSASATRPASIAHDATPLSNALGLPVLCDDPAPLSRKFGWSVLKTDPEDSTTLQKIRRQSADAAPLSRKLGLAVLKAEPESSTTLAGIRRQSEEAAPLSKRLGWRTLSDNPTPLSSRFGWKVLLDDPAPLSRMLGWSVLSKR